MARPATELLLLLETPVCGMILLELSAGVLDLVTSGVLVGVLSGVLVSSVGVFAGVLVGVVSGITGVVGVTTGVAVGSHGDAVRSTAEADDTPGLKSD